MNKTGFKIVILVLSVTSFICKNNHTGKVHQGHDPVSQDSIMSQEDNTFNFKGIVALTECKSISDLHNLQVPVVYTDSEIALFFYLQGTPCHSIIHIRISQEYQIIIICTLPTIQPKCSNKILDNCT